MAGRKRPRKHYVKGHMRGGHWVPGHFRGENWEGLNLRTLIISVFFWSVLFYLVSGNRDLARDLFRNSAILMVILYLCVEVYGSFGEFIYRMNKSLSPPRDCEHISNEKDIRSEKGSTYKRQTYYFRIDEAPYPFRGKVLLLPESGHHHFMTSNGLYVKYFIHPLEGFGKAGGYSCIPYSKVRAKYRISLGYYGYGYSVKPIRVSIIISLYYEYKSQIIPINNFISASDGANALKLSKLLQQIGAHVDFIFERYDRFSNKREEIAINSNQAIEIVKSIHKLGPDGFYSKKFIDYLRDALVV